METRNQTNAWKYIIMAVLSFIFVEIVVLTMQGRPFLDTLFVLGFLVLTGLVRLWFPWSLI